MVRIGLIADTHIPEAAPELPEEVIQVFRGMDMILHAGDLHVLSVLDRLEALAPVYGVRGNGDDGGSGRPVVPEDPRLKETQILSVEGLRIGMLHTLPWFMEYPHRLSDAVAQRFGKQVDIIVHGDTHVAEIERREGVLLVNPGSPTLPNNLTFRAGTVALLEIAGRRAQVRLLQLRNNPTTHQ